MVDFVVSDDCLQWWFADVAASGRTFTAKLAKNNVTPGTATVLADFTEADYTGYSSQTLGAWGTKALDGAGHREYAAFPAITFPGCTGGGGNNVYAVYIVDDNGHYRGGWRIGGAPLAMNAGGPGYSPTLTFDALAEFTS